MRSSSRIELSQDPNSCLPTPVVEQRLRSGLGPGSICPAALSSPERVGRAWCTPVPGAGASTSKVGAAVSLQVVSVAEFSFEYPEQGEGDAHSRSNHSAYTRTALDGRSPVVAIGGTQQL